MSEDRKEYGKVRPYYTLEFDPEEKYRKQRAFSLYLLFGFLGIYMFNRIWDWEEKRALRTERHVGNIEDLPAHHFINKGGVLIKKEFEGFAKYFRNDGEHTEWLKNRYPAIMNSSEKMPAGHH